jgi:hypothetical protein
MNRRELIKYISLLTGSAVVGTEFFLSGCKSHDAKSSSLFTESDIVFFDEVAETILPRTNTAGAKDAEVGKFMASYASNCYDERQLKTLKDGIAQLNDASDKKYGRDFLKIDASEKQKLLTEIDAEAKEFNEKMDETGAGHAPHYFTLMKQLTLLGFFTSRPGTTQVLRYEPVPGKYHGCIDYKEGETSWA